MKIKKIVSIFLAVVIALSASVSVNAISYNYVTNTKRPTVLISGDSDAIYTEDGKFVYSHTQIKTLLNQMTADKSTSQIVSDVLKKVFYVLSAYYIQGCLFQNFDEYYDRIYETFSGIFGEALCNKSGEVDNGTDIEPQKYTEMWEHANTNHSTYDINQYRFRYDWRLDPLESADQLNAFIETIKRTTGYDKLNFVCRCVGGNVFLAYVSKYGTDSVYGVGFDGTAINGCEILSEPVAGKFVFDANAVNRLLLDLKAVGMLDVDPKIPAVIDFLSKSGIADAIKFAVKFPNYNRIIKGITSSLSLSTFYTWPNYWACFNAENFEIGKEYVFGEEGSDLRKEYAGLIEKIDNYDKQVRQKLPQIMQQINDNCNLVLISKYGMQSTAIGESRDLIGDQLVTVKSSSFGATTSTIFEPLSDEYVANQIAAGKGKYISPDHQIDASTCMFPDQTFFIKGASHSDWTKDEMATLAMVMDADEQLYIDDLPDRHFMVFDYETETASTMTEENCHCENWVADKSERTFDPIASIKGFFISVKALIDVL